MQSVGHKTRILTEGCGDLNVFRVNISYSVYHVQAGVQLMCVCCMQLITSPVYINNVPHLFGERV